MGKFTGLKRAVKKFRDRHTHEVPTGPHTDVKRRKINPSSLDKSIESGRTKERKRKQKVMGMGLKNVVKRMVGQKEGGRIGKQHGGRTNLLEELGRVEGEHSNRNRRAEVSRIHGELNRGYKGGKRVGLKHGTSPQQHYLEHGYGPHKLKMAKASDKATKGNKLTKKA